MGSSFDFRVYETDNKKKIQSEWISDKQTVEDEYPHDYVSDNFDEDDEDFDYDAALEEGIDDLGYSGQINTLEDTINWANIDPLKDEHEATDYIDKHHEKWSNPIGVPFKVDGKIFYAVGGWCSD
jgi:hypothetical protein